MSSREPEQSRHVGRVVDPALLADGELEPRYEPRATLDSSEPALEQPFAVHRLSSDAASATNEEGRTPSLPGLSPARQASPVSPISPVLRGCEEHPSPAESLKEHEASPIASSPHSSAPEPRSWAEAERSQSNQIPSLPDPSSSRRLELEQVAGAPHSAGTGTSPRATALSPNLISVFGALLGIATVAALIAIAMRLDQRAPYQVSSAQAPAFATPPASVASTTPTPPAAPTKPPRTKLPSPYRVASQKGEPNLRWVEGRVGYDPFLKAVEKAGVPIKEAYRILKAFEGVHPLTNCSRHDTFVALLDRQSRRLKAFEYIKSPEEVFQAREGSDGLLKAMKLDLVVRHQRVNGAFFVGPDGLVKSIEGAGLEAPLAKALASSLSGHHSLAELEPGTTVRVLAEEVTSLGEFVRYSGLEALEVKLPKTEAAERFYFFNHPEYRGFFDQNGRAPFEGGWRHPVPGAPVTSKFNMRRLHPVLKKIMPHTGVDFGAEMGTPVYASSFGTITYVGFLGPNGNMVKIAHPDEMETGYSHLSRFAEGLRVGDKVKRLQLVGYIGSTGRSTGPHLHFSAKRKGKFIDPESLKLDGLRVLPPSARPAFEAARTKLDGELNAIPLPSVPADLMKNAPVVPPVAPEGEEMMMDGEGEGMGEADPAGAAAAPSAAAPSAAAPSLPPAGPTSGTSGGNALYLTDEELLRMQGLRHDGEVE